MSIDGLRERTEGYAALIDVPPRRLPMFGPTSGQESLRIAEGEDGFVMTSDERGTSTVLFRSPDETEVLYQVFLLMSFDLAQSYVAPLIVGNRSRRDIRLARQLEMMDLLEPSWATRLEDEIGSAFIREGASSADADGRLRSIRALRATHPLKSRSL